MSDAARTQELVATYDHLVRNYDGDPVNITTTNNATLAILSRSPPWLRVGQDYAITSATGLQPGTWFNWTGSTNIRLSLAATGGGNRECNILPRVA